MHPHGPSSPVSTSPSFLFLRPLLSYFRAHAYVGEQIDCFARSYTFVDRVLYTSLVPVGIVVLDGLVYLVRLRRLGRGAGGGGPGGGPGAKKQQAPLGPDSDALDPATALRNEHVFAALLLSYLVLPTATLLQFHGLDCVEVGGQHVLWSDTGVDCDSPG